MNLEYPILRENLIRALEWLAEFSGIRDDLSAENERMIDNADFELDGLWLFDRDASEVIGIFLFDQAEADAVNEFAKLYDTVSLRANDKDSGEWISYFVLEPEFDQVLSLAGKVAKLLKSRDEPARSDE